MPGKSLAWSLAAALLAFGGAYASDRSDAVPGEKLDSGLGALPPYREWKHHPELSRLVPADPARVEGEKLDSGLGALPPYREWKHHPELARFVVPETGRAALARAGR